MNQIRFILQGDKITMRRVKFSDFRDIFDAIRDKDAAKWAAPLSQTHVSNPTLQFLSRVPRYAFKTIRYLYWKLFPPTPRRIFRFGVLLNQANKIIGMVILNRHCEDYNSAEIGFWLTRKYWGQGIMTDAVRMAIDFAFRHLELQRIDAWTVKENVGAQKVLLKCGFTLCEWSGSEVTPQMRKMGFSYKLMKSDYHGEYGRFIPEENYAD